MNRNAGEYQIIHLPKEQWKNSPIPMRYTTEEYFDVRLKRVNNNFRVDLVKTKKVKITEEGK